jgi:hypothetical protein
MMGRNRLQITIATLLVLASLTLPLCISAIAAEGSRPISAAIATQLEPKIGDPVDVAPSGELRTWNDGQDVGVLWEDARDIFKVVVGFAQSSGLPDPSAVKLQYWRDSWPNQRVPRDKLVGSGGSGWMNVGDWYKGHWQDADVKVSASGSSWTYTFNPINDKEVTNVKDFPATYRTTLKMRLLFPSKAPAISSFQTYTDSTWEKGTALIEWGGKDDKDQAWDGKAEIFNGKLDKVQILSGSKMKLTDPVSWTGTANKKETGGIVVSYWFAKPAVVNSFDETIVTIRAKRASFSFLGKGFLANLFVPDPNYRHIYLPDYGVIVRGIRDNTGFDQAEADRKSAQQSLYQQVQTLPEQTLTRALADMPPKTARIYMPLAVEGGRQHFRLEGDGNIVLDSNWEIRAPSTDSGAVTWGRTASIDFQIPRDGAKTGASIEDDFLPIARTWYEKDGIRYDEEAFATVLAGVLPKQGRVKAEEPQVCMVRWKVSNKTGSAQKISVPIAFGTTSHHGQEDLEDRDGVIYGKSTDASLVRFRYIPTQGVKATVSGKTLTCEASIPANGSVNIEVALPFLTPKTPADIDLLKKLTYDGQHGMIAEYWRRRIADGTQVSTPDPMLNDFYAANATHQLINTDNEPGADDRAMANVGTFGYGVYANESIMMVSELDRRGYHDVAQKALQTWIHYQGTVALPGDYTTADGEFYGAHGHESGGYNQHHGWVLWGMGEHYWFTHDKAWLTKAAPSIIKACDWITKQRSRTKTSEFSGIRAIEYGLLPPGSLEDIGDWRSWLSNNVFSWWGLDNVARALADIGHPQAKRLLAESAAYKDDIRKAYFEAMVRSPVVMLRDGTFVPDIPSDVHRRGRSFGWITETLEGSIHLLRCGIIAPTEPAAKWIMQDYEDNRYISDQFGYQINEDFDKLWFSRGGFSQQPSLLCSPTPYLQMDLPKNYLRAYFNAFAAGYFPERAMLTEHPLPNLGDYRGDHFKSSDEAMNTSWIRWMFIWDEGKDLYLGKVMPRYWLANGKKVSITKAATHFGPMSMVVKSYVAQGRIEMTINPPTVKAPGAIYARFRHPQSKMMKRVTVNGKPYKKFDPKKEWVVLPALKTKTVVVAYY